MWHKNILFSICFLFFPSQAFAINPAKLLEGIHDLHLKWMGRDTEDHLTDNYMKQNPGGDYVGPLDSLYRLSPESLTRHHLPAVKSITHREVSSALEARLIPLGDGSREEVFESFSDFFTKGTKDSHEYEPRIFGLWWLDPDFRRILFESMTEEHIDNVDVFFKWWNEARVVGVESRLKDFTESSLRKMGVSIEEFMGLGKQTDETDPHLVKQINSNPFLGTVLKATGENEHFIDSWLETLSEMSSSSPNAVGKRHHLTL